MKVPEPYSLGASTIKAFVLGCDPTAFTKTEKEKPFGERKHLEFKVVFDIGADKRYFAGITAGANQLHRPLIPFYRHPAYSLKKNKEYAERIKAVL